MPPKNLETFDHLAGVELRYCGGKLYGTRGTGPRRTLMVPAARQKIEGAMCELFRLHPWGPPDAIMTLGGYSKAREKNPKDPHGRGIALDIGGFWWKGKPFFTRPKWKTEVAHYLAIEAVLFRSFHVTVGAHGRPDHEDHFHVDTMGRKGAVEGYTKSWPWQVRFVQAALTHVFGIDCGKIDGLHGAKTGAALDWLAANTMNLAMPGEDWQAFCFAVAEEGFEGLRI